VIVWVKAAFAFLLGVAVSALSPARVALAEGLANAVTTRYPTLSFADQLKIAAKLVAIGWRETGLRNDIRGDNGESCSAFQTWRSGKCLALERDPKLGATEALIILERASLAKCDPLEIYAVGHCGNLRGQRIASDRNALAARLVKEVSP